MRVLIAHGDATSRYALREVAEDLSALGLKPVESSEGAQTVELLTGDDAPALAVVDWDLPGVSGPELCRQVRRRCGSRSPYIILIAPSSEQVDEAFAAGANDCLRASATGHELQARIVAARRLGALGYPRRLAAERGLDAGVAPAGLPHASCRESRHQTSPYAATPHATSTT